MCKVVYCTCEIAEPSANDIYFCEHCCLPIRVAKGFIPESDLGEDPSYYYDDMP